MKSLRTVPTPQLQEETLAVSEVKRRRRQRGFTLIEMLAVVIILAIVAGVGFVVVNKQIETARNNTDLANLRTIADAANRYIMDGGAVTDIGDNNGKAVDSNSKLIGNYLGSVPKDPWGGTGNYTIKLDTTNKKFTVTSPHAPSGGSANSIDVNY